MKRSMMQVYVKGSDEAVALYQEAFGAKLISSYPREDGTFDHAELDVQGQVLAVAEAGSEYSIEERSCISGNTMQFCFHYGEGNEAMVERAFEVLQDGAQIVFPLGPCEYSPLMVDLIDKFGVRWCLFV